ncbi:unnamed protein product [Prunus armeniaca]
MKLSGIIVNILKWDFWLKDGIAPVSLTLSLSRASLSLLWFSRQPLWPATFWPAVLSSGHQSRRGRYQNDRAAVLFLPQPGLAVSRRDFAGKSKRKARFRPKLRRLRSPSSGRHFWRSRVRPDFGMRFRPLPVSFWGTSKNKSDSKLGVLPRVGVLSRDLQFFRRCDIALDTSALPARVAARGHCS